MIELRQSPCGLWFQVDPENKNLRFKKADPKSTAPPALPPAAAAPSEIVSQAGRVGEKAGRRLRKRTGRASTRRFQGSPTPGLGSITQPGLSTNLAGVTA